MASRATDQDQCHRFELASPCAKRGHSTYARRIHWRVCGRERVLDRPRNVRASNIGGMPRHKGERLLPAAGIVLPERRFQDCPPPLAKRRWLRARQLSPLPRLEHIAVAATLVLSPTTASIRSQDKPNQFSDSPRCRPSLLRGGPALRIEIPASCR